MCTFFAIGCVSVLLLFFCCFVVVDYVASSRHVTQVEMLNVLQDIGEAQSMLSSTDSAKGKGKNGNGAAPPAVPHPTDVNYGLLNADLKPVHPKSKEHEVIK